MVLHRVRTARLRRGQGRRGRDPVRAEHGEIVVRFETRRVPRMGEDREETEVPRRRAGEGTDEPAPRHPGEHGAERLRRDRRPDHAARQADVTRSDNPTIGRKSLQPGPAYRGPWPRKKSETHGSVRGTGPRRARREGIPIVVQWKSTTAVRVTAFP